jgi:c-di-GMP-binding flagellar brake protein YcgR
MGANFVLQKPVSALNASRCFHAALNFMVKERRRYFRYPIKLRVQVSIDDKIVNATSANISEGGISLMLREALPKGASPRLRFSLPDSSLQLDVDAEIAWADMKGFVGLRFTNLPKGTQEELEHWLDENMEKKFPGAKQQLAAANANLESAQ